MHDYDEAAIFSFDTTGEGTDHIISGLYDDSDVIGELIPPPAGPHDDLTTGGDEGSADCAAAEPDPSPHAYAYPPVTGNPALDIDLSDAYPDPDPVDVSDTAPVRNHPDAPQAENVPVQNEPAEDGAAQDGSVHGNPVQWTIDWFYQQVDGYCGPAVVGQLVAEYTGANITDPHHLVDRAVELGLMSADDPAAGMTLPAIETLLEDQGVPATISSGTLDDLRGQLDDGHAVIAMVDSGEIWQPEHETVEDDTPDHVLVVAGIDDARGVVLLSDPGVPNGSQLEVPIEVFEQAWADSGHQMLVADQPDPDLTPTHPFPASTESAESAAPRSMVAVSNSARTTVISLCS